MDMFIEETLPKHLQSATIRNVTMHYIILLLLWVKNEERNCDFSSQFTPEN